LSHAPRRPATAARGCAGAGAEDGTTLRQMALWAHQERNRACCTSQPAAQGEKAAAPDDRPLRGNRDSAAPQQAVGSRTTGCSWPRRRRPAVGRLVNQPSVSALPDGRGATGVGRGPGVRTPAGNRMAFEEGSDALVMIAQDQGERRAGCQGSSSSVRVRVRAGAAPAHAPNHLKRRVDWAGSRRPVRRAGRRCRPWPRPQQLAALSLHPGKPEVQVGHHQAALGLEPEGAPGVQPQAGIKFEARVDIRDLRHQRWKRRSRVSAGCSTSSASRIRVRTWRRRAEARAAGDAGGGDDGPGLRETRWLLASRNVWQASRRASRKSTCWVRGAPGR